MALSGASVKQCFFTSIIISKQLYYPYNHIMQRKGQTMFTCEKLKEKIISIVDSTGVRAFLIEGMEKAVLIDTCCGIGNLKELVDSLTPLPLSVLCTHGHVDHAGGAYGFERVYLNKADWELVKEHTTIEKRSSFVDPEGTKFSREVYVPQRNGDYLELKDGQIFDLGGITIESIAVKGHTQGMTCFLIKEHRTLILGDACNPFTFMFLDESSDLRTLIRSLNHLLERQDEFDTVWLSHGDADCPKSVITDVIEVCDDIFARRDDAIPFESLGRQGFIAKVQNDKGQRADGKVGNVVYGLNKI